MAQARRHSIPSGDVVLCSLPPYSTQPWLSMGVVLHYALLAGASIRARVVRPLDAPFVVPEGVLHASNVTFTRDPSMEDRIAAMEREYVRSPEFFDGLVDELLRGGERVVGLSLFRNDADVTLFVARLIKARSPSTFVVLGGPEAIEEPEVLRLPWVDAVVGADAEAVLVPLVRSLLDGRPALGLPNVWLNPGLEAKARLLPLEAPSYPTIDYAPLVPLLVGDPQATMPLLLNWGCPYRCGFCSNKNVYSRFSPGSVERVMTEMDQIMSVWASLHDGKPPGITLQLSDATTNALPNQFDELLTAIASRRGRWATRPMVRGQTLFDSRITDERARLMQEGCFGSTFFGLESGSDRLRRALDKPASVAHVASAMESYHRTRAGGLHFGIPVGIPGETDEDFAATESFVEWSMKLTGTIDSITVLPYAFFLTAQDPTLGAHNRGERRGVLWRTDGAGGDPAVRARRFMRLFDLVDQRVSVNSPFPPYLFLPEMLGDEVASERWMERHGRSFDQITPTLRTKAPAIDPEFAERCGRARTAFEAATTPAAWTLETFDWSMKGNAARGLAVVFRHTDARRFALLLEPARTTAASFARAGEFAVSYLKEWNGTPCVFDRELMAWCVSNTPRS